MKTISNIFLPFKPYMAMNLCGILFVRKGVVLDEQLINHELIHTAQMKEMAVIFFYIWYVLEWSVYMVKTRDRHKAYRSIRFEREAYQNDSNLNYLHSRKHYSWISPSAPEQPQQSEKDRFSAAPRLQD